MNPKELGLCYLATPYTLYPSGTVNAFLQAAHLAAELLKLGYNIYSPIVHSHPITRHLDCSGIDWVEFHTPLMDAAKTLIVGKMFDWESSVGVANEIKYFSKQRKPIYYIDPITLVIHDRWTYDSCGNS